MGEVIRRQVSEAHRMRSRRSILAEVDLRKTIKKINTAAAITERRLREGQERVARLTKWVVVEGQENARPQLDDAMRDVATQRDLIKACEDQRALTEAEIEKLTPDPAQRASRQHQQEQFAELVNKRLAKDREADRALKELREALRERRELTAQMAEPCAALELTIQDDGLDRARFEKLLDSLPGELLPQSGRWCAWFLGEPKDAKPYRVRVEHLLVAETLTDNGVLNFGDVICLREEEARNLLCDDYFAGTGEARWRCEPPKVMTVEAYEAAEKAAREKGLSVQEVIFWQDVERDAENKKWFINNGARKTFKKRAVSAEDNSSFESTIKVRVKCKGEIIEVPNDQRGLDFVANGSGGPP